MVMPCECPESRAGADASVTSDWSKPGQCIDQSVYKTAQEPGWADLEFAEIQGDRQDEFGWSEQLMTL